MEFQEMKVLSMPRLSVARMTVMLSVMSRLYIASLTSSLATFCGSCSIRGISISLSLTMFTHSWLLNRSKSPSEASSTKWSRRGSIVTKRICTDTGYSGQGTYLGLDQHKVLDLFLLLVLQSHLDVFAVEVAKGARDRKPAEHATEDYVTALLLDAVLLVLSRGLVVQGEVHSLPISA